jgi:DNA-binding transcriptional regulator YhcF (GntR family)
MWRKLTSIISSNFNFTDQVRRVLAMTREEAIRLQHDYVGTEHILLSLIREEAGVAAAVLASSSVRPDQVRDLVERSVRRGKATIALGTLPYASGAKKVLEFAMSEARDFNHNYVGTEHLLLALLREEKGVAAMVLTQAGLTLAQARSDVLQCLGAPKRLSVPFLIRIDDHSSASIYEQIVAKVQEAVATEQLRPGDRLPTVRQLADQLDIAPGTVARAYGELERLGVVVTEGARGTRVAQPKPAPLPQDERQDTLTGLLRPVAVAAFHLGATAADLRAGLERAMEGIFDGESGTRTAGA